MSALAVMAGCGAGGPDRQGMLTDLAENGIVPVYQELGVSIDDLSTAVADLCAEPDPTSLATAREALVNARTAWSTSEPMWVGPVMERRSWAVIDWPIETDEIESLIADTTVELDDDRLANRIGADQRGLQAVEYILGDDDTVVIEQLDDPRRCVYLTGIADVMADEAEVVLADWTTGDGGEDDDQAYVATFSAGDSSGLDSIVNDALILLEAISDAELGTALGEMEASADPEAVVEGPAGLATADVAAHLTGLRVVLVGDGRTSGIGPLLGDDLRGRLTDAFDEADAAVGDLGSPLRAEIESRPDAASSARDAIKEIQLLAATEIVSRLGVTIGFSDADGDTGN